MLSALYTFLEDEGHKMENPCHRPRTRRRDSVLAAYKPKHEAVIPTPSALRAILAAHNEVEEGPAGVYETCEQACPGPEAEALLVRLRTTPEVPVSPHTDGPAVMNAMRRALARAGYNLEDYEKEAGRES